MIKDSSGRPNGQRYMLKNRLMKFTYMKILLRFGINSPILLANGGRYVFYFKIRFIRAAFAIRTATA